jgi:hypothetical protein
MQIRFVRWGADVCFKNSAVATEVDVCFVVAVVRKSIAPAGHEIAVSVAAENLEASKASSGGGLVSSEDSVAGEEEVLAENAGCECGAHIASLDHGDGEKAVILIGIEGEARWEKRLQSGCGKRIGEHQYVLEVGLHGERVALQEAARDHGSIIARSAHPTS